MSTYLFVECYDHTGPQVASRESGQHRSDLVQLRADLAAPPD